MSDSDLDTESDGAEDDVEVPDGYVEGIEALAEGDTVSKDELREALDE